LFDEESMAPVNHKATWARTLGKVIALATLAVLAVPALQAQSGQNQSQPPATSQPSQDIPDAPSTVQPPSPKPAIPVPPPGTNRPNDPIPFPGDEPKSANEATPGAPDADKPTPPPMPPVETVPPGSVPRNQLNAKQDLYTISTTVNFVALPVMVRSSDGRPVEGLLARDFTVKENGKPQTLTYFTSDPFELSVAIVLDIGVADVALQKINQTYSALAGAFSPYDEVALYTYSSTVSQVMDFSGKPARLTAALDEMKLVRGRNNGPPVMGGPLGPQGPSINGLPAGGPPVPPVNTPPREAHVLNDAILRAALDLSKRERTRRKVIFVISDGRELGSKASYSGVLHLLQTRDIQVRAVVIDSGALPLYKQLDKFHIPDQGRTNLLTRYVRATCGAEPYTELSRNAIEDAYAQITNEARNQYTLGYSPAPTTGSSAYRTVEVIVHKKGLKVAAKDGYFAIPTAH
jgi:VWFA-related protein